jgi:Putative prokaryotic signal transducing protein
MRAVLKTIDPVVLNYAANVLEQEGIEAMIFDTHASVMDGSMGFLPRRLMVLDEDFDRAQKLLRAAVPDAM